MQNLMVFSSGIEHYGVSKRIQKSDLVLVTMLCGFEREINHTYESLLGNGLEHTKYNMYYHITLCYW
jgi:hypothetical protein